MTLQHLLFTKAYYKDLYTKRYPELVWNTQKHLATPISLHPTQTPLKAPTAATAMGLTAAKTLLMHHQPRYFWNTNLLQQKSRISDFGKHFQFPFWTFLFIFRNVFFLFRLFSPENPGCDHSAGLRQDWQERRHWEDPGGKQVHRGRAETLVRHAGQPPSPHRPVASAAAGGGGGCSRRSHKCQEVKLPPEHIAAPQTPPLPPPTCPMHFPSSPLPPHPGPTYQCIFQKEHP